MIREDMLERWIRSDKFKDLMAERGYFTHEDMSAALGLVLSVRIAREVSSWAQRRWDLDVEATPPGQYRWRMICGPRRENGNL